MSIRLGNLWISVFVSFLSVFLVSCACRTQVGYQPARTDDRISIYRRPLELRFSNPKSIGDTLVIYATGDGGWKCLDREIFDLISAGDYPAVGFSSKNYLKNLEYIRDSTTPSRLVRDFERIILYSEQKFGMPESTKIVLVGLSRGAGLGIVAAGKGDLKPNLAGVIAVALTREEEHVLRYARKRRSQPVQPGYELVKIQTYEYLPRIDPVPVVVLQSTHDSYLPAAQARTLFGQDTETRKLIPISARNHRFSGGKPELFRKLEEALAAMCGQSAAQPAIP